MNITVDIEKKIKYSSARKIKNFSLKINGLQGDGVSLW